jgi:hypothetical protein
LATASNYTPTAGDDANGIPFDPDAPGVYTFFAECACGDCASERVAVRLFVDQTNEIPNAVSIGGDCHSLTDINSTSIYSRSDFFPGSTDGGVLRARVNIPYTNNAAISTAGDETIYLEGAGCFQINYSVMDGCNPGPASQDVFVQIGLQPEPFFSMQNQACYTPGPPITLTPFIDPFIYDLANDAFLNECFTVLSGPATLLDPTTGEIQLTGMGTVILEYKHTLTFPACGTFPELVCEEKYQQSIIVTDGDMLDATFTADNDDPCLGETVTFTANVAGGLFEGVGVTDNGDGTATWTPIECGNIQVDYTLQNGACTNVYSVVAHTDLEAPTLVVPAMDGVECGSENVAAWLSESSASDNCTVTLDSLLTNTISGCGNSRTLVYEFTATDECGNSTSGVSSYVIFDNSPPTITTPPSPLTVECNEANIDGLIQNWLTTNGGAAAEDGCGGTLTWSNDYGISAVPDCADAQVITVLFVVSDECGNLARVQSTINIEDTTSPNLNCPPNITVECGAPNTEAIIQTWLATATTNDRCDLNAMITNDYADNVFVADCGAAGAVTVTFTATDACGNDSTCVRTITIDDTTPPTIALQAQNREVECNGMGNTADFDLWLMLNGNALASDLCDSDLTWTTIPAVPVLEETCGNAGEVTVEFVATDDCGNASSTIATFTIVDEEIPTMTAPADLTVACGAEDLAAWIALATAEDDCDDTPEILVDTLSILNLCGGGLRYDIQFMAADACGNVDIDIASYFIEDQTNPDLTCPMPLT